MVLGAILAAICGWSFADGIILMLVWGIWMDPDRGEASND